MVTVTPTGSSTPRSSAPAKASRRSRSRSRSSSPPRCADSDLRRSEHVALLADLIHNFGDALTAVPLGIAFFLRSFRGEKLAGLAVVAAIPISALVALYETIRRLIHPQELTHLWVLAAAGLIGFIGNEIAAQVACGRRAAREPRPCRRRQPRPRRRLRLTRRDRQRAPRRARPPPRRPARRPRDHTRDPQDHLGLLADDPATEPGEPLSPR